MFVMALVLAGVAAGDGGMRAGAATAPLNERLRLDTARDWEGTVHLRRDFIEPVRVSKGQMTIYPFGIPATQRFALTLSPGGLARVSWGEGLYHGTFRVEGDRLLFCVGEVDDPRPTSCTYRDGLLLFILKPAARKP
jgi:hypothetical protein